MKTKIKLIGFDYVNPTMIEEISRNLAVLFATPEGTCAGDRSYGINQDFVGLPAPQAANRLALEAAEKIAIYEPRAQFYEASCTADDSGTLTAVIRITANPDYEGGSNV